MNLYDVAYSIGLGISAPYWLAVPKARRKVLRALRERMGRDIPSTTGEPVIMIHAVSLGEINATRGLVQQLAAGRPGARFVISTTTDTGFARGQELYGQDPAVTLIRYPLDFTSAVARCLDAIRPSVVALMELELWPNLLLQCQRRGIPVVLLNGRITEPSFRKYRLIKPVARRMLRRLAAICVQDGTYAARFAGLGACADRIRVTGTMKFDTATVADSVPGDRELAAAVGLRPGEEPIWVCGSTGPGEEALILPMYRELLKAHPRLRLVIVPRHPERFGDVGTLITGAGFAVVRRSQPLSTQHSALSTPPVILGDTMGELRKFYSLADVIFVGRTLVDLGARQHGSDMIEPAALGKPVIIGRFHTNFAEAVNRLREADGIRIVFENWQLQKMLELWLPKLDEAAAVGRRAQQVVAANKGATERSVRVVLEQLETP